MPLGTVHRLSGLLLRGDGGLVLHVDDGGCWRLCADRGAKRLVGSRVEVAGIRAGFDLIDVERIGVPGGRLPPPRRSWWRSLLD